MFNRKHEAASDFSTDSEMALNGAVHRRRSPRAFRQCHYMGNAEVGNDGANDIVLSDSYKCVVFHNSSDGTFDMADYHIIPGLPPLTAVAYADFDSVPELFVMFKNMGRRFYQVDASTNVNDYAIHPPPHTTYLSAISTFIIYRCYSADTHDGSGALCSIENDMVNSIDFADMNSDCQVDLVFTTKCSLGV